MRDRGPADRDHRIGDGSTRDAALDRRVPPFDPHGARPAMSIFEVIVLALIQGATEFLPVSSSGHLVLANAIMGVREPGIAMEIVLHFGTLFAVLVYFRR